MLTKILFRVLPDHYPAGSTYAHFPFIVPPTMRNFLSKLVDSPVAKYTYARPGVAPPVEVVEGFETIRDVIKRKDVFESTADRRLLILTKGVKVDIRLVSLSQYIWPTRSLNLRIRRSTRPSISSTAKASTAQCLPISPRRS